MNTQPLHSPTPWEMDTGDWPVYIQRPGDDRMIAVIHAEGDGYKTGYNYLPASEQVANAAFLLNAVNAHVALCEALDTCALVIHAGHPELFAQCPDSVCRANHAALTLAKVVRK